MVWSKALRALRPLIENWPSRLTVAGTAMVEVAARRRV